MQKDHSRLVEAIQSKYETIWKERDEMSATMKQAYTEKEEELATSQALLAALQKQVLSSIGYALAFVLGAPHVAVQQPADLPNDLTCSKAQSSWMASFRQLLMSKAASLPSLYSVLQFFLFWLLIDLCSFRSGLPIPCSTC